MSRLFGWDLPPGCSVRDIERAAGADGPEICLAPGCGAELDEANDPEGTGVCSPVCAWPAIAACAEEDRKDHAADAGDELDWWDRNDGGAQ